MQGSLNYDVFIKRDPPISKGGQLRKTKTMFQYDIAHARDFSKNVDKEDAFYDFLKRVRQSKDEFPFEVENSVLWKGRPNHYRIVGWGGYMCQEGWRVYITYRTTHINHVRQHSWLWDNETDEPINYKLLEFIQT